MDIYYKLLIIFRTGDCLTRKNLLHIHGIDEKLIDEAEKLGLIVKTTPSDIGEVRYKITEKGKKRW